jgi:hypothetical protein
MPAAQQMSFTFVLPQGFFIFLSTRSYILTPSPYVLSRTFYATLDL